MIIPRQLDGEGNNPRCYLDDNVARRWRLGDCCRGMEIMSIDFDEIWNTCSRQTRENGYKTSGMSLKWCGSRYDWKKRTKIPFDVVSRNSNYVMEKKFHCKKWRKTRCLKAKQNSFSITFPILITIPTFLLISMSDSTMILIKMTTGSALVTHQLIILLWKQKVLRRNGCNEKRGKSRHHYLQSKQIEKFIAAQTEAT